MLEELEGSKSEMRALQQAEAGTWEKFRVWGLGFRVWGLGFRV